MSLLWIPIILIVVVSVVGTIFYLKKRKLFLEHQSFVEFWGIALSILFALLAFLQTQSAMKSSTEDFGEIVNKMNSIITKAEESSKSLHNVDSSLSKLPEQMDSLSKSIISFNDVILSQRKQLTFTLNELSSSVLAFKTTVDTMIERFNRKPDIDIELLSDLTDSTRLINTIVVTNNGKLLADIYMMRFMIDTSSVISVTKANETNHWGAFVNYQVDYFSPDPVYEADRVAKFDCNFILKNSKFTIFRVIVFYRASFGNDGTKKIMFLFKKNQNEYIKIEGDNVAIDPQNLPVR